jgi:hypothetical protein
VRRESEAERERGALSLLSCLSPLFARAFVWGERRGGERCRFANAQVKNKNTEVKK